MRLLPGILILALLAGCGVKGRLVPPDPPPDTVGGVTLSQKERGVILSWSGSPSARSTLKTRPETGYRILRTQRMPSEDRCIRCDDAWTTVATLPPGRATTITDSPLDPGTVYRYRIIPVGPDGTEGRAADSPPITLVTPPAPPRVNASLAGGGVLITLSPPEPPPVSPPVS